MKVRRAKWLAAVVWCLSWFELYLEIYRHRHVSSSFLVSGKLFPPNIPADAHAGWWLRSVLIASSLAPVAFLTLFGWERVHISRDRRPAPDNDAERFPLAAAVIIFGLLVALLGAINQVIRHPPLSVDLTLRTGDGGFVVLGVALILFGWLMTRRDTRA